MKKFFKFGCLGFIGLIVLIIVVAVASSGGDDQASTEPKQEEKKSGSSTSNDSSKTEEKATDKEGVLTEEKFDQIKDGMTYEEVVAIVGAEGTVMSESGDKGTDFHTVIYEFETDGFMSSANMTFQGNKLLNKSQFGLGEGSEVEISLEQFNQIQNGMTYEEVVEIVGGEGEIVSESGEKGTDLHTVVYSYSGNTMVSNVTLMFQGNKLQNKSQAGLE